MYALEAYDELLKLKDDPEAFIKRQKEIIGDAISQCPTKYQKRLAQQQWCLEQLLSKYKDPTARMNKMVELFWSGVSTFEETLRTGKISADPRTHNADVILFKKK